MTKFDQFRSELTEHVEKKAFGDAEKLMRAHATALPEPLRRDGFRSPVVFDDADEAPRNSGEGTLAADAFAHLSRMFRNGIYRYKMARNPDGLRVLEEGDSWHQFPVQLRDLIDHVRREFAVYSLSSPCDTFDEMLQQSEYEQAIADQDPHVLLFSAGGNDIIGGGRFGRLLCPYRNGASAEELIDQSALRQAVAGVLTRFEHVFQRSLAQKSDLRIFVHGYDHVMPREGGSWLAAPLKQQGIPLDVGREISRLVLDQFNEDLAAMVRHIPEVTYVDFRGRVGANPASWVDELHPKSAGFGRCAELIKAHLRDVLTDGGARRSRRSPTGSGGGGDTPRKRPASVARMARAQHFNLTQQGPVVLSTVGNSVVAPSMRRGARAQVARLAALTESPMPLESFREEDWAEPLDSQFALPLRWTTRTPVSHTSAHWPLSSRDAPDTWHLPTVHAEASFVLTTDLLSQMADSNLFPLRRGPNGNILFALRGAEFSDGTDMAERQPFLRLRTAEIDHENPRCIIGIWHAAEGMLSAFVGSTVPRRTAMKRYFDYMNFGGREQICNLLPTGKYTYCVGQQLSNKSGAIDYVLRQGNGPHPNNASLVTVQRTFNDLVFDTKDMWDVAQPGDNILPGFLASSFASSGALTLPGNQSGFGAAHTTATGLWKRFRRLAGFDGRNFGARFDLMLLTGHEAATWAETSSLQSQARLTCLRHGSSGRLVAQIQKAMGAAVDGVFGAKTKLRVANYQTSVLGYATGTLSAEMAELLRIDFGVRELRRAA